MCPLNGPNQSLRISHLFGKASRNGVRTSIGLAKSPFSFFCKIRDTFFIYFTDLDILSVSALSCYWLLVGGGWGAAKHLPMCKTAPQQRIIWPECH